MLFALWCKMIQRTIVTSVRWNGGRAEDAVVAIEVGAPV